MEIFKLLEYSVAIAGIVGIIVVVKIFIKFISNHMGDATRASQRLADMIERMLSFLEHTGGRR